MNILTLDRKGNELLELTQDRQENSIFQTQAHESVSKRYDYLNTKDIVDFLAKYNWIPVKANQSGSKKYKGYQKHIIEFENDNFVFDNNNRIRIIMQNSHNGKSSLQFKIGIFRLVCSNGMVVGNSFKTIRLRHSNINFESLYTGLIELQTSIPKVYENIDRLKSTLLTNEQIIELAKKSMMLRFEDKHEDILYSELELIKPLRPEDIGNSAWLVFNRLQEKIINGKAEYTNSQGKKRKMRKIKAIDKNINLNSKMFDLALSYLN